MGQPVLCGEAVTGLAYTLLYIKHTNDKYTLNTYDHLNKTRRVQILTNRLYSLSLYTQDFHHDVSLKQMLMVYLSNIKQHKFLHSKEGELVEGILRYVLYSVLFTYQRRVLQIPQC